MSDSLRRLDEAALRGWPLPPLDDDCDKEKRGRLVIIAGSREIPGAGLLCAEAAMRAGAGKVVLATAASVAVQAAVAMPELRVVGLPETAGGGLEASGLGPLERALSQAHAVLVGPGLQDEAAAVALARAVRTRCPKTPLLLDAAAMGAVHSALPGDGTCLVTPHAGEMAHLTDADKDTIQDDPRQQARDAARHWRCVVALKGATTVIVSPEGQGWVHEGGNVGLATAGSGDVLAGLVAGFATRGATLEQAAAWGVVLHALAGERLAHRVGHIGYLAREIAAEVPALVSAMQAAPGGRSSR